jgi:hypothetical protein
MKEEDKIQLTRDQLLNALCRMCMYPDSPEYCPERKTCTKRVEIGFAVCKNSSLRNEVAFQGY